MVLYARGNPEKIRELREHAKNSGLEIVLYSEVPLLTYNILPMPKTQKGEHNLTPRQLEILAEAADGLTNQAIAESFKLSEQTVKNHLSSVYGKLHIAGYGSRAEASAWYDENVGQSQ